MILVLDPNTRPEGQDYRMLTAQLERLSNVDFRVHREVGSEVTLTEIYLIGNTAALTGGIMAAAYSGFIICPPLTGWIADQFSLQTALITVDLAKYVEALALAGELLA